MTKGQLVSEDALNKFKTSDYNLGLTKRGYAVPNDSVYTKEIWNEAIEQAALIVQPNPHIDGEVSRYC